MIEQALLLAGVPLSLLGAAGLYLAIERVLIWHHRMTIDRLKRKAGKTPAVMTRLAARR